MRTQLTSLHLPALRDVPVSIGCWGLGGLHIKDKLRLDQRGFVLAEVARAPLGP